MLSTLFRLNSIDTGTCVALSLRSCNVLDLVRKTL